jgi:hypothetical protein
MSRKTIQALPCLLTCPVVVSSFLAMMTISRWPIFASAADGTENATFVSYYDQLRNVTTNAHVIIMLVLCQDAWSTMLSDMDMLRSSDRILRQVPWLIPAAAAISSTIWVQLTRTNVATSWILSSVLTTLGYQYAHHLPNCFSPVQKIGAI